MRSNDVMLYVTADGRKLSSHIVMKKENSEKKCISGLR